MPTYGPWPALTQAVARAVPRPPPPVPQVVVRGFETVAHYVEKHPIQVGIIAGTTAVAALTFGAFTPEAGVIDASVLGADAVDAAAGSEAAVSVGANVTGVGVENTLVAEGATAEEAAASGSEAASAAQAAGRITISSVLRGIGNVGRQLWSVGKPVLYGLAIGEAASLAGHGIASGISAIGGGIQYLLTGQPPQYQMGTYPPFAPTVTQSAPTPTAPSSFLQSPLAGIIIIGGLIVLVYAISKR